MTPRRPWLWVVADVNGAGKTTLVKRLLPDLPFLNADEFAADLSPDRPERAAVAAGRAVLARFRTIFRGGDGPSLAMQRVADRVLKGGHDIPDLDVQRRYSRSLSNLADLLATVDLAYVFDNSGVGERGYRRVVRIGHGAVMRISPPIPQWLSRALPRQQLTIGAKIIP